MTFETFTEGYTVALNNLERYIEASINRNGGVRTSEQAVKVLNEVIYYLHSERLSLSDAKIDEEDVEFEVESIDDVFDYVVKTILGGKR